MERWPMAGRLTAGVATTLMLLGGCGGGSGGSPAPAGGGTSVGTEKAAPLVPAATGGLTAHFRDRLAATAQTAIPGPRWAFTAVGGSSAPGAPTPSATAAPVLATDGAATGNSTPVLQEAGVDEGDVLVTDGAQVYALGPRGPDGVQALTVRTVTGGGTGMVAATSVPLPAGYAWDTLYRPSTPARLVATGLADTPIALPTMPFGPTTAATLLPVRSPLRSSIRIFDLADPVRPSGGTTLTVDGRIQASRMVGSTLWMVLVSEPRFDGFDWSWNADGAAANRRYIASLSAASLLPTISRDGATAEPLVTEEDCYVQPDAPGGVPAIVTLVSIDLSQAGLPRQARCFAGSTETVYMTRDSLYLASVRYPHTFAGDVRVFASQGVVTDLHKFALSGDAIAYRGSGRAPGRLSWGSDTARFMLSESGSDLRVVTMNESWATGLPLPSMGGVTSTTTTTSPPPPDDAARSPARLTVLRDTGNGLSTLATLPNASRPASIGKPGEQVYAVRYVGKRAYVVTFRRTDPLYVIDLADASDPALVGQLEVPGFSDRLYPLTDTLLLGVGHDAVNGVTTGVRVSLLDVSTPDRPVERAARTIGGRGSASAADLSPHGTMIRRVGDRIRVALPVERNGDPTSPANTWQPFSALEAWRFVVDPVAGTWAEPAPVKAPSPDVVLSSWDHLPMRDTRASWLTRSLDLGDTSWLYYDGRFTSASW